MPSHLAHPRRVRLRRVSDECPSPPPPQPHPPRILQPLPPRPLPHRTPPHLQDVCLKRHRHLQAVVPHALYVKNLAPPLPATTPLPAAVNQHNTVTMVIKHKA